MVWCHMVPVHKVQKVLNGGIQFCAYIHLEKYIHITSQKSAVLSICRANKYIGCLCCILHAGIDCFKKI